MSSNELTELVMTYLKNKAKELSPSQLDEIAELQEKGTKNIWYDQEVVFEDLHIYLYEIELNLSKLLPRDKCRALMDSCFNEIIQIAIDREMLTHSTYAYKILYETIVWSLMHEWKDSASTMISLADNVDSALYRDGSRYDGYNPLMMAVKKNNQSAVEQLLRKSKRINHSVDTGLNALYLAILEATARNNLLPFDKLLEVKNLQVMGVYNGLAVFDLVRKSTHISLFNRLVDQVQQTFDPSKFYFEAPLHYPIALLTQAQQDVLKEKLLAKINELDIFINNPTLKQTFIEFLESDKPLPFKRLNRLAIAFDCISYLLHPEKIKQSHSNLCGPATLMQHLAMNNPTQYIFSVLEMAEIENKKEKHHLPSTIKSFSKTTKETGYNLLDLWLETVRHNYNTITGYSNESKIENILGITSPFQLEKMYHDFGYNIEVENMQVVISTTNTMGKVFDQFRRHILAPNVSMPEPFKIYGRKHVEQQSSQTRFNTIKDWFESNQEGVATILITVPLCNQLLQENSQSLSSSPPSSLLNKVLPPSHYVNVKNFTYNSSDNTVSFDCLTYGKKYEVKNFNADEFKKGCLGGLLTSPSPSSALDKKYPR